MCGSIWRLQFLHKTDALTNPHHERIGLALDKLVEGGELKAGAVVSLETVAMMFLWDAILLEALQGRSRALIITTFPCHAHFGRPALGSDAYLSAFGERGTAHPIILLTVQATVLAGGGQLLPIPSASKQENVLSDLVRSRMERPDLHRRAPATRVDQRG